MSQYERAKASFKVNSGTSEEFEVNVGMQHGTMLSHFLLQLRYMSIY